MDYTKPIKSRRLLVEHLLAVMHTANLSDCDSHSLWVTGLDWINKYYRTFDNKNVGLGHTLHNTLYTMVYGLLTEDERKVFDEVSSSEFDTSIITD